MSRHSLRTITAFTALLGASLLAAACSNPAVEALPTVAPTPGASATATATPTPGHTVSPLATMAASGVPRPPACLHAAYKVFDTAVAEPWPALCIEIGGVLRIANSGPGTVSMSPLDKTVCFYEAGVHECRLVRTGTVRFTVDKPSGPRVLTLVVAATSPGSTPACVPAGQTQVIEVRDATLPWSAVCLKLGAVLRFENLGPGSYSVMPAGAAACFYEAGVSECRFSKTGTVVFTFPDPQETRTLTVVAIK